MSLHQANICLGLLFASGLVAAQTAPPVHPVQSAAMSSAQAPLKTASVSTSAEAPSDDDTSCPAAVPQSEFVHCMGTESTALENQIDAYVRAGLEAIDHNDGVTEQERANERREFIAAQKSWKAFRDHLCSAWYWNTDGTGAKLDAVACREKADRRRIRELLEFPGIE